MPMQLYCCLKSFSSPAAPPGLIFSWQQTVNRMCACKQISPITNYKSLFAEVRYMRYTNIKYQMVTISTFRHKEDISVWGGTNKRR